MSRCWELRPCWTNPRNTETPFGTGKLHGIPLSNGCYLRSRGALWVSTKKNGTDKEYCRDLDPIDRILTSASDQCDPLSPLPSSKNVCINCRSFSLPWVLHVFWCFWKIGGKTHNSDRMNAVSISGNVMRQAINTKSFANLHNCTINTVCDQDLADHSHVMTKGYEQISFCTTPLLLENMGCFVQKNVILISHTVRQAWWIKVTVT